MARPSRRSPALLAALLAVAVVACDDVPDDAIEQCSASQVIPGTVATDILFVIDDSGSMAGEQATLQAGLATFIGDLAASPIANDYQIGVTTTSVVGFNTDDDGTAGGVLVGGIMRAGDANLVSAFQSAVAVGTSGYGREQPFTAARRALEKSANPSSPNYGFLRPGTKLAVFFLSDEDDCSGAARLAGDDECQAERIASPSRLVSIPEVVDALSAGGAREVVAAAVVGVAPVSLDLACVNNALASSPICADPPPTCPTCCATAYAPGHRFVELIEAVGAERTRLASICDADFDQALTGFANAILGQTLPLDGAPADWRLLVAHVERAGTSTPCTIAPDAADAATRNAADAIYEPPREGRPASLTFQNGCALEQGDRVFVDVVCVR